MSVALLPQIFQIIPLVVSCFHMSCGGSATEPPTLDVAPPVAAVPPVTCVVEVPPVEAPPTTELPPTCNPVLEPPVPLPPVPPVEEDAALLPPCELLAPPLSEPPQAESSTTKIPDIRARLMADPVLIPQPYHEPIIVPKATFPLLGTIWNS